jgi:hypothetical protein
VDAHVNAAWQTGMAAQGKAEAPPYSAMQQDIEKKKAFVAGVQAANGGLGQYAVNAAEDSKAFAAANKKAEPAVAALQKDAKSLDTKPAAGQSQGKAAKQGAEESAAAEDDEKPKPKPAEYKAWNTASPDAKEEAWEVASKKEKKSLGPGEFQMLTQKKEAAAEAAKIKFDPKAGTFSNIPVDPVPKKTGPAPSQDVVEEQLGMSITPSQYKQWLKNNGF